MAIKVEKNIPIPAHLAKYPFHEMELGDSFFVAMDRYRITNAATAARRRTNMKFSIRKYFDDASGVEGFRVWRTK